MVTYPETGDGEAVGVGGVGAWALTEIMACTVLGLLKNSSTMEQFPAPLISLQAASTEGQCCVLLHLFRISPKRAWMPGFATTARTLYLSWLQKDPPPL